MPNPDRTYKINFNLVLDEETDDQLIRLARELSVSKAHICRAAIANWYGMKFQRTPTCADLQECRCPHAHIYPPTNLPADRPSYPSQDG